MVDIVSLVASPDIAALNKERDVNKMAKLDGYGVENGQIPSIEAAIMMTLVPGIEACHVVIHVLVGLLKTTEELPFIFRVDPSGDCPKPNMIDFV
ncbi:unnamed protein product [Dovyalis caffra]|uniref:Uncharacterized protein n=1 Tax=Dovyalis caffra TaxID=77055 RepID=A0AAV1RM86_9ROSI|nr:unnamed protein product [Dovyalis caffra]